MNRILILMIAVLATCALLYAHFAPAPPPAPAPSSWGEQVMRENHTCLAEDDCPDLLLAQQRCKRAWVERDEEGFLSAYGKDCR